jgi:hypothetical protein
VVTAKREDSAPGRFQGSCRCITWLSILHPGVRWPPFGSRHVSLLQWSCGRHRHLDFCALEINKSCDVCHLTSKSVPRRACEPPVRVSRNGRYEWSESSTLASTGTWASMATLTLLKGVAWLIAFQYMIFFED